jgi:hypothetical protein
LPLHLPALYDGRLYGINFDRREARRVRHAPPCTENAGVRGRLSEE